MKRAGTCRRTADFLTVVLNTLVATSFLPFSPVTVNMCAELKTLAGHANSSTLKEEDDDDDEVA